MTITVAPFDWAAFLSGLLGSAITAAGVFYAARQLRLNAEQLKLSAEQHKTTEHWRRIEFASELVERLSKDEELAFCTRALDWGVGPLIIPVKYRVLFKGRKITIDHNWEKLARAVQPNLDRNGLNPELLVYRYCFDSFGGYLETIGRHVLLGTASKDHLVGLGYLLGILVDAEYYAALPNSMKLANISEKDVFTGFFETFYRDALPLLTDVKAFPGAPAPQRSQTEPGNAGSRAPVADQESYAGNGP